MGPLLSPRVVLKHVDEGNKEEGKKKADQTFTADNLYIAPSFLNHSCEPNAHRSFFRDDSSVIFVKAIKDISEGEEVTISYVDLLSNLHERAKETEAWDF